MKTRIIALVMLIVLCLSSCAKNDMTATCASGWPYVDISAEFMKKRVKMHELFEIEVSFYQVLENPYPKGTLEISAANMIIISPNGSIVRDNYSFEYLDFDDDKYRYHANEAPYSEQFRLIYIGSDDDCVGEITILVSSELKEPESYGNIIKTHVKAFATIYYKVWKGNIWFTTKRILNEKRWYKYM